MHDARKHGGTAGALLRLEYLTRHLLLRSIRPTDLHFLRIPPRFGSRPIPGAGHLIFRRRPLEEGQDRRLALHFGAKNRSERSALAYELGGKKSRPSFILFLAQMG